MLDFLQTGFLATAFLGALLSAAATALLSVFVSLKKASYMSEAFAHVSFAGVALALLLGLSYGLVTMLFVTVVAFLIGLIAIRFRLEEVNVTTVFLSVSMALGVILLSLNKRYTTDIADYLFGNVLLVTGEDILLLGSLVAANLSLLLLFFKELFYIAYNQEIARIFGVPVRPVYFLFLTLLAVNVVVAVKIVGLVLVTAQLILPGLAALNLVRGIRRAIALSVLIAVASAGLGFAVSYPLNLPTGATIVLVLFVVFLLTLPARRLRRGAER